MKTLMNHLINSELTLVIFSMLSSLLYGQVYYQVSLAKYRKNFSAYGFAR